MINFFGTKALLRVITTFISSMRLSNKPIAFSMSWGVAADPKSPISNGSNILALVTLKSSDNNTINSLNDTEISLMYNRNLKY